jgi:hypothetical protein
VVYQASQNDLPLKANSTAVQAVLNKVEGTFGYKITYRSSRPGSRARFGCEQNSGSSQHSAYSFVEVSSLSCLAPQSSVGVIGRIAAIGTTVIRLRVGDWLLDIFLRFPLVFQGFDPFSLGSSIVFAAIR